VTVLFSGSVSHKGAVVKPAWSFCQLLLIDVHAGNCQTKAALGF